MILLDKPVVILAGGQGTRLREETEHRPKPMVKIGHQPILWHIMKLYSHYGFRNFIVCLGYKGEVIREFFYHYKLYTGDVLIDVGQRRTETLRGGADEVDWKVILADTGKDTLTGGRLRMVLDYVGSDEFFVTYGDGIGDVNIGALLAQHRRSRAIGTVTAVHPVSRFGEIATEGDDVVTDFHEKQVGADWINGGFFVFSRRFADYLDGDDAMLEQAPLRRLTADRLLAVYRHAGFWQCMDTYREVELLNGIWASGRAPWKAW